MRKFDAWIMLRSGPKKKPKREWVLPREKRIKQWKIWKGDYVCENCDREVGAIKGCLRGQKGTVLRVFRKTNYLIVDGVNMHKATHGLKEGKDHYYPRPVHYSSLALIDPSTGEPTKIMWKFTKDGIRTRVSKDTLTIIPFPEFKYKRTNNEEIGPKDTLPEDVLTLTFDAETLDPFSPLSLPEKFTTHSINIQIAKDDPNYRWRRKL